MNVWVSKEATGRPNDQRATIKCIVKDNKAGLMITVEMLGDGKQLTVGLRDIVKIELVSDESHSAIQSEYSTLSVDVVCTGGYQTTSYWPVITNQDTEHKSE